MEMIKMQIQITQRIDLNHGRFELGTTTTLS